jgi:PAS domain S-box-containing protein
MKSRKVVYLQTWKEFLVIVTIPILLLFLVAYVHYQLNIDNAKSTNENYEKTNVTLGSSVLKQSIKSIISDLRFLTQASQIQLQQNIPRKEAITKLTQTLLLFSQEKVLYDQVRFISKGGNEIIRINRSLGQPFTVDQSELQNKYNRYYFKETYQLERNEVYISPFDLNIENGNIEDPIKPMIRFGSPLYDTNGHKIGILLINFLGANLLNNFETAITNISDHTSLLNMQGYWLRASDSTKEWAFMYGEDITFKNSYSAPWEIIKQKEQGQFATDIGLFTFNTIAPSSIQKTATTQKQNNWKVVTFLANKDYLQTSKFKDNYPIYFIMLLIIIIGSFLATLSRMNQLKSKSEIIFEKRFRQTLENIHLLIVGVNKNGIITFCNERFLELCELKKDQVIGRNWFDYFEENHHIKTISTYFEASETAQSFDERLYFNEQQYLTSWNAASTTDGDGNITGLLLIGEDITDYKENLNELLKLSKAIEQSPATVIIVNIKGEIEYANPKFTQVTGYTFDEVKGKNPRIFKSGETRQSEYQNLWSTIKNGGIWRGTFHNKNKQGEFYWEDAIISPVRDSTGEITHFLAVKEDITGKKSLQLSVEKHNKELAINEGLAVIGKMSSMIAHDLRNPLSSIKMGLQILNKKQTNKNSNEKELLHISLEQVGYMENILEDLTSYSRPDKLQPEWIQVEKIMDNVVLLAQRQIEDNHIHINKSYQKGLPAINADPKKLKHVLSNLFANAVQACSTHNPNGHQINITIQLLFDLETTKIIISICDSGIGLQDKKQSKLFEAFFTTKTKGTGLGLAIVKRILDQHGGKIELTPNETIGACATVELSTSSLDDLEDPEEIGKTDHE